MSFVAPGSIPGLDPSADRALGKLFTQLENDLTELGAGQQATILQSTDYVAKLGDFVRVNPPASGVKVLLPASTVTNQGQRVLIGIESVVSGGSVTLRVAGGLQSINGASTVTATVAGLVLAHSTGYGWVCTLLSAGGGSGGGTDPRIFAWWGV